ncbi:MAG: hypothetical protein JJE16_15400 [Nitrospiraceae bacterium]|nr:hypothetical protein [Nitrospiraceae bacterium]
MIFPILRRTPSPRKNTHETVLTIVVVVFILVPVLHLLRIAMGWEVPIGGVAVPIWASYLGMIIAGGLDVMLWRELR